MDHKRIVRAIDHLFQAEQEINRALDNKDSSTLRELCIDLANVNRRLRDLFAEDNFGSRETNQWTKAQAKPCKYCEKVWGHDDHCPALRAANART